MSTLIIITSIVLGVITPTTFAQVKNFTPVTQEMLLNPSPNDWLMFSRTAGPQRDLCFCFAAEAIKETNGRFLNES